MYKIKFYNWSEATKFTEDDFSADIKGDATIDNLRTVGKKLCAKKGFAGYRIFSYQPVPLDQTIQVAMSKEDYNEQRKEKARKGL
jgi:hypothetical protein